MAAKRLLMVLISTALLGLTGCQPDQQTPAAKAAPTSPAATRAAAPSPSQAGLDRLTGTWDGTYTCSQGLTGMHLKISPLQNGVSAVVYDFYPVASNPSVAAGSINFSAALTADGSVALTPGSWIDQPDGYVTVTLNGALPAAGSDTFTGTVTGPACTTFTVTRGSVGSTTDAACSVAALVSRHEGGIRRHVYLDSANPPNPTVGIGFNLNRPDAQTALQGVQADYAKVRAGTADLTDDQSNKLFAQDLASARTRAASFFPDIATLVPARQAVLVDMAFNIKPTTLSTFEKFNAALVAGDYATASREMLDSDWADQTKSRAIEDTAMMMTGRFQPGRCAADPGATSSPTTAPAKASTAALSGSQLLTALILDPAVLPAGYENDLIDNVAGQTHVAIGDLATTDCKTFWQTLWNEPDFGRVTAFALTDYINLNGTQYDEAAYQFSDPAAAQSYLSDIQADATRCGSFSPANVANTPITIAMTSAPAVGGDTAMGMKVVEPAWSTEQALWVLHGQDLIVVGAKGAGTTPPPTSPTTAELAADITAKIDATG